MIQLGDLPCFTAFLFYGPNSNVKFITFTYTCDKLKLNQSMIAV